VTGRDTIVACCQIRLQIDDQAGTRRAVNAALSAAADGGAQVIVLPELASTGYLFSSFSELDSLAESLDGPTLTEWKLFAQQRGVIIVGGFAERGVDGKIYNSAVLIDETGLLATHRKTHLWDQEKAGLFTAGSEPPPVVETAVGRIGLMVCYDLEFPEWVRTVAESGAVLLCGPVSWPLYPRPTAERPGEIIRIQAAASSNRIFIAIADRTGIERGQEWLGGSIVVDPDGYPATTISLNQATILYARLTLSESRNKAISGGNHVHEDRRPDLYR